LEAYEWRQGGVDEGWSRHLIIGIARRGLPDHGRVVLAGQITEIREWGMIYRRSIEAPSAGPID